MAILVPQNGMSSAMFSEAMFVHLCLPPIDKQASRHRVGEYIGRSKVDLWTYGSAELPVKTDTIDLFMYRNMPSTCEAFGLFSNLVPQEGNIRMMRNAEARNGTRFSA